MTEEKSTLQENAYPAFQRHPDTTVLLKHLGACDVGELITYDRLSELLGRDYRKFCRNYGQTARKRLEADGIYFEAVPNEGYRRLSEVEKITIYSDQRMRRSRRQSVRGLRTIQRTELSKLDDETRREAITRSAQFQALELFTSRAANRKIEARVEDSNMTLAIGQTLALFQQG